MTALANTPDGHVATTVGKRTELARYTVSGGERILYGQRVDGVVRLTDVPASGIGRRFLIERGLEQDGNAALEALVADYLNQASAHDQIPVLRPLLPELGDRSEEGWE